MSGPSPSWHHAPGEFCTHPDRVFIPDNGPPIEGPWDAPDLPSELPKVDGHWVCPGHTAQGLGSGPGA